MELLQMNFELIIQLQFFLIRHNCSSIVFHSEIAKSIMQSPSIHLAISIDIYIDCNEVYTYLEHPPISADWVESKLGIVVIYHHMGVITDP